MGRLTERDINILREVYNYQAVKARDLSLKYFGSDYGLERLRRLCDRDYLYRVFTTATNGRKDKSVYQITDKAIDELYRRGLATVRRARDMRVSGYDLLSRLAISELFISLPGWKITNSRDAKPRLGLPKNSLLISSGISPEGKEYAIYYLTEQAKQSTIDKIVYELGRHAVIVLYKTQEALEYPISVKRLLSTIKESNSIIPELCLLPLVNLPDGSNMALEMLKQSDTKTVERYLRSGFPHMKKITNRYHFGDLLIEKPGGRYLVCNYLRRDIIALGLLSRHLTDNEHQRNGYSAIVLTWQGYADEVIEELDRIQSGREYIEILPVTRVDLASFL